MGTKIGVRPASEKVRTCGVAPPVCRAVARPQRRRPVRWLAVVLILALAPSLARGQDRPSSSLPKPVVQRVTAQPLAFEARGTAVGATGAFISRGPGYSLALTPAEAVIAVDRHRSGAGPSLAADSAPAVFRVHFAGASPRPGVGLDALPGIVYHVTDTVGPIAAQRTFRRVKYDQVYPGVDAMFHGDAGKLEFDFVVAPHADPSRIRLALSGTEDLRLNDAGDLVLRSGGEQVILDKPVAYQVISGVRRDVPSTFVVGPSQVARIAVGEYDRSQPLVIDPTITFASYFGSEFDDSIRGLETDAAGNVYTFGTVPAGFGTLTLPPTSFFGPQAFNDAPADCFVGKLLPNPNGALTYSWLAIFHDSRTCEAMTVAPDGRVYVARTLVDERVTVDVLSDATGLALDRRFPLAALASATHLRVNGDGHLYAIGGCSTESFQGELWPLPNGFQPGPAGVPSQCVGPGAANSQHLIVIANDLGDVFYGSFFGFGTSQIEPTALALEPGGSRAYIAGQTLVGPGQVLITTPNARQTQQGDTGCEPNEPGCNWGDAFLIVVDPAQSDAETLAYTSYFGGRAREHAVAMALDGNGLVHLVANTESEEPVPGLTLDSPAVFSAAIDITQDPSDQIVEAGTLVEGAATRLLSPHEGGLRFRLLPDGSSAILAHTDDPAFPLVAPLFSAPRDPSQATSKPLLIVHRPVDGVVFSSYLDDTSLAEQPHLAVAPGGTLYVALQTTEFGRSTDGTAPLGREVLLFGIDGIGQPPANSPPVAQAGNDQIVLASTPLGTRLLLYGGSSFDPDGDELSFVWTEGPTVLATGSFVEVVLTPGDHVITLTVDDGRGGVAVDALTITVVPNTPAGGPQTVTPPDLAWSRSSDYLETPVTVRFANVTAGGFTSLTTRYLVAPMPPPGMQFGSPPLHFDLASTSAFSGGVDVCVDYRGMSFARPDGDLRLYQQVSGTWMPLVQTNDTTERRVCGSTTTLGTFALFTPAVRANEISLLAGQPVLSSCRSNPGLDPNDGGLATASTLCNTRGLAFDAARNYLYFAEAGLGDAIRRIDLATNRITTVAGTGFITGTLDGAGGDPRDDDKNNVNPLTAPLNQVLRVALDPAGNLLLAEYGQGRIRKIDFAQNLIYTVASVSAVSQPSSLVIDASGAALFAGFADGERRIWRLTPGADGVLNGSPDEILQSVAGTSAQTFDLNLIPPTGIDSTQVPVPNEALALGPDGSLYTTGWQGHAAVVRITPGPDGLIDGVGDTAFVVAGGLFAGPHLGDGTAATTARVFLPIAIAVAPNGDVYVGDTGNPSGASVRKISAVDGVVTGAPDETITTVAGFHLYDPAIMSGNELPFSNGDGHALSSIFGANFDLLAMPNGDLLVNDFYQIRRIGPRSGGDSTPPVLTLPGPIVAEAEGPHGAVASFLATALDGVDGAVAVSCSPVSGSTFSFNGSGPTSTTVTCSATDAAGNTASGSFTVTVQDTTAPVVRPPSSITVAATEATGARANVPEALGTAALSAFLAGGTVADIADAAPVRLTAQRVDCSRPSTVLEPIAAATLFTVGRNCVEVAFRDGSGNVGRGLALFDVAAPVGGHVNAAGVTVVATDLNNAPVPVTASFAALQQPGLLTAAGVAPPAAAPAGLAFHGQAFDVRATALAPPAVTVCLSVPGIQQGDRLLLFENGTWVDRTASVDVAASRICGVPTALGIYAIARQNVVIVDVAETIFVTDTPVLQTSALVDVLEQIVVTDEATPLPSALIDVAEQVLVTDVAVPLPSATIDVVEQIVVTDTPGVTPVPGSAIVVTLTPKTADVAAGAAVTWTAVVNDGSSEEARVLLTALAGQPRVQFVNPGVANAPLSVSVNGSDITVSLATGASGNLTTTASHVVQAINASPAASAILAAETWPGAAGSGIVQPRALASLSTVRILVGGTPVVACLTSVPGWCTASYARSTPGTESVVAFLDVNANGVREATEPFDTAAATWADLTPPTLTLPGNMGIVALGSGGASVSFAVSAVDGVDGPVPVSCSPASGTTFPIGTTTVVCTAVDQAGNNASGSFNVTVSTSVGAVLQLASGVIFAKDANGRFVGSITIRNGGSTHARDVRVTTAILNTTPAVLLPVQFGDVEPGARITRQVTFPDSAGTAGPANNLRVTIAWLGGSLAIAQRVQLPAAAAPLWGWVDLHTHPMSNLAFGGKLFHGAPDVQALMPAIQMPYDAQCRFDVPALNMNEALSDDAPTHGDWFQSKCGNFARNALVQALELFNGAIRQPAHAVGSPTFVNWPRWNDITHQKMWIDWIRRARDGGLRVMVALSHNNRTLAELMGTGAAISGVRHDRGSSDLQIAEIKSFAARHPDLMKVALNAAELYQIVQDGKIAIILGVEVDNIGNFNDVGNVTTTMVEAEIDRLYAQGVRYIFPVHLTDNVFGDTALYSPLYNIANRREMGTFWSIGCGGQFSQIGFQASLPPALNLFIPPGIPQPPQAPPCLTGNGLFLGHVNARTPSGITSLGQFALRTMMKRGMIIDVDHLSDRGVETALGLAEAVPSGGYPLVSGHSALRDGGEFNAENSRTRAQLQRIGCLQGMFGLGTDGAEAYRWASQYRDAFTEMGKPTAACPDKSLLGKGRVALGTDTNSLVKAPRPTLVELKSLPPRFADIYNPASPANDNPLLPALSRSTAGSRTWDYNTDGVAHYGMFADFVKDLRTAPAGGAPSITGKDLVDNHLLQSADYFFRMWQKIETQKTNVP